MQHMYGSTTAVHVLLYMYKIRLGSLNNDKDNDNFILVTHRLINV
eukprot:COSAG02_NODE_19381_length_884_cov_2.830573_1_plen_45_part_00